MTDSETLLAVAVGIGLLWLSVDADDASAPAAAGGPAIGPNKHGDQLPTIAQARDIVLARGVDLSTLCGVFEWTKQSAWMLRNIGAGLVDKPGGTNCDGYSVDGIMFQDGQFFDTVIGKTSVNGPSWSHSDTIDPGRWRSPLQMEG